MDNLPPQDLVVSVVTYAPDLPLLAKTLGSLVRAISVAGKRGLLKNASVYLVDNGPGEDWRSALQAVVDQLGGAENYLGFAVISGHGNVGFGAGHNLAISRSSSVYYLILNPDVILGSEAIAECFKFMAAHPSVTCLSPISRSMDGERQFLVKRYPTLLDLGLRGFAPRFVKRLFQKRLARYEMEAECGDHSVLSVPIVSGCFMFFRNVPLQELKGFSPEYFLYFEDFDLSLRAGKVGQLAYVPAVKITHFGGHTSRKGWRHVLMFVRSGYTFFQTHGWKLW
ncbi:MAG: glycosyltransferase [Proteobacteria bacterium]|nr:glycosyltransferase [Pseudomonadota bacterium]MBU1715151.1 glycosyltransferase [Pseudomonadota bacterium]